MHMHARMHMPARSNAERALMQSRSRAAVTSTAAVAWHGTDLGGALELQPMHEIRRLSGTATAALSSSCAEGARASAQACGCVCVCAISHLRARVTVRACVCPHVRVGVCAVGWDAPAWRGTVCRECGNSQSSTRLRPRRPPPHGLPAHTVVPLSKVSQTARYPAQNGIPRDTVSPCCAGVLSIRHGLVPCRAVPARSRLRPARMPARSSCTA